MFRELCPGDFKRAVKRWAVLPVRFPGWKANLRFPGSNERPILDQALAQLALTHDPWVSTTQTITGLHGLSANGKF